MTLIVPHLIIMYDTNTVKEESRKNHLFMIYEDELLGDSDDEQQQAHVDIPQQPQVMIL